METSKTLALTQCKPKGTQGIWEEASLSTKWKPEENVTERSGWWVTTTRIIGTVASCLFQLSL